MKKKSLWEEAVELSFAKAQEQLRALKPRQVAKRSDCQWHGDGEGYLEVNFLDKRYRVAWPEAVVQDSDGNEATLVRAVLILHYLTGAQGKAVAGIWTDFRSLPGGIAYYPAFRGRVIGRLLRLFGSEPQKLISAAKPLGGQGIELADVAVKFWVFPRVPVVFGLWHSTEEFGPEATVMYDAHLPAYLQTEDAIIVCEEILGELKQHVKKV